MPPSSDDTIPHAAKQLLSPGAPGVEADTNEIVRGDTVMRDAEASATDTAPVHLPPVPAALRAHHRIRVGDGTAVELDRAVHIGRRPRGGRVPQLSAPHLIEVASPEGGISATHLELREQGVAVVATDMRTLNGSEVRVPGSPARTLLRGESVVVTPGTRIDLGEGVVIEILAPASGAALGTAFGERTP
jgi:hypothetical protein